MIKPQYRAYSGLQLRAIDETNKKKTVFGTFSVYNVIMQVEDWLQEMIMPGCFADSVRSGICNYMGGSAIKCLYQHNPENVLGSVKSGTFRLQERQDGLYGECDLPNHALGNQIGESMSRGDIDETSIGFLPTAHEWIQGAKSDLVKILQADLKEGSVANFPKNTATSISLRAALPDEIEDKSAVCRALNRYKNDGELIATADDRSVLEHYRSLIEPKVDEETRVILKRALSPEQKIIPVSTFQAYLEHLPKWRD